MTAQERQVTTTWRPHRWLGAVLICILLYALLGFLVAPWLAKKNATNIARDKFGAELALDDVSINPFTFTLDIENVKFSGPDGKALAHVGSVHADFQATSLFSDTLKFAEVRIEQPEFFIRRDAAGEFNFTFLTSQHSAVDPPETKPPSVEPARTLLIEQASVRGMAVTWTDETVAPYAELGIDNLDLTLSGLSTEPSTSFPVSVTMELRSRGSIDIEGDVALLPQPAAELALVLQDVSLELLHPYVKPLADVTIESGALNFDGTLATGPDDPFLLSGNASIDEFLMTETVDGTKLGSWDRLAAVQLSLSLADRKFEISQLVADELYTDILIAKDGSVNLMRVEKGDQATEPVDDPTADPEMQPVGDRPAFDVIIGRVDINDASANFVDHSLPLPFAAQISELNGHLSTIATSSSEASTVSLEGRVDEFGLVKISGSVTPLNPKLDTDISVDFENVEMPKFSAYTIRFAGHEIKSGKLDLALRYVLTESNLAGENKIVLRDFELGEKVPHPDAKELPLRLAIALLKDPSGRINVDLPIRGNLEDPEFKIGGVIGTALGNLLTGIITAPFRLLGNLIGLDADELEALYFPPGRSDLSPPQVEIAGKLAEALGLRPELVLEIPGAYSQEADAEALRTATVNARIEVAIDERSAEGTQYAQLRLEIIRSLSEDLLAGVTIDPETDGVAYAAELRRRLIEAEPVTDTALIELADVRAANARAAILEADPALVDRIVLLPSKEVRAKDNLIKMKIELTVAP